MHQKNGESHVDVMHQLTELELFEKYPILKSLDLSMLEFFEKDDVLGIGLQSSGMNPFFLDLKSDLIYHRQFYQQSSVKKDFLYKALFGKKERCLVYDATGGLLKDAMRMISFGGEVYSFERNVLVSCLVESYLKKQNIENFEYHPFKVLETISTENSVIYYDPMYKEESRSKRLGQKKMRIFQAFIKSDDDAIEQLHKLRMLGARRVVVKRPIKAMALHNDVHHQVKGKSTRYDIYLP